VSGERLRFAAIGLFAAAAVLVGVGRDSGQSWLVIAAFVLFTAGAFAFLRWRTTMRANVFDRQDKTSDKDPKP
jgi:protein-S-isoprenylcysteine O-methyltransferase Ste14